MDQYDLKYDKKHIGWINIRQEINSFVIDVEIINTKLASFPVIDEFGMYTIIDHILTKFNYAKSSNR